MSPQVAATSPARRKIVRGIVRFVNWRVKANRLRIEVRLVALARWKQAQVKNEEMIAVAKAKGHDMSWVEDLVGKTSRTRSTVDSH